MSLFIPSLDQTLTVSGLTVTSTDEGGQPVYTSASKGSIRGRIDPQSRPAEVNGPDLQPIISDYLAVTELPSFSMTERDVIADETSAYEILRVSPLHGRNGPHHLELSLRKVTS